MKKFVVFVIIIALIMVSVTNTFVSACDNTVSCEKNKLIDLISAYLCACGFDKDGNYYYSSEFIIENENNEETPNRVFFIFNDKSCIGELIISESNSSSSFSAKSVII